MLSQVTADGVALHFVEPEQVLQRALEIRGEHIKMSTAVAGDTQFGIYMSRTTRTTVGTLVARDSIVLKIKRLKILVGMQMTLNLLAGPSHSGSKRRVEE